MLATFIVSMCLLSTSAVQREHRGYLFDAFPTKENSPPRHSIADVSDRGEWIELEDGSIWKISRYDQRKALLLPPKEQIAITQTHRCFPPFPYRLVHQNTGMCLEASLSRAPSPDNPITYFLSEIDPVIGRLTLANPSGEMTHWDVSRSDLVLLQNWTLLASMIIGQNSGKDAPYEAILINADTNCAVQAKQLFAP